MYSRVPHGAFYSNQRLFYKVGRKEIRLADFFGLKSTQAKKMAEKNLFDLIN
jgi:hypothetical protein